MQHNRFPTESGLRDSLAVLDPLWSHVVDSLAPNGASATRTREAAALVAHTRWMCRSALARTESRAMHLRDDGPDIDPAQTHRIWSGGLDDVWTAAGPAGASTGAEVLAS